MSILKTDKLYSADRSTGSDENILLNDDGTTNLKGNTTVTGVCTATSFSGSGASLTALPAANLTGTLPAISGASLTNLPTSPPAFRNLIINGAMNINQRGAYTGQGNAERYATDRFEIDGDSGMVHSFIHQDTGMAEFPKCLRMDVTTAATSAIGEIKIVQPIESQNLVPLLWGTSNAKSITISFWVRSNQAQTYVLWLYKDDGGRHNAKTYTISAADTWEKKTITFSGDQTTAIANDNTRGLQVTWVLNTGTNYSSGTSPNGTWESETAVNRYAGQTATIGGSTNDYFDLTGVQVEEGTTATAFEHKTYDEELSACQRYFQVYHDKVGVILRVHSSTQALGHIPLHKQMRDVPTYAIAPSNANFDVLDNGSVLANQGHAWWTWSAGGARQAGWELMGTRGAGTWSDLNTVIHANFQYEYGPSDGHYFASATSEL